jgi:hypothetical protein
MAAKTVKANATNGAADPTNVPVAVSELLAGTTTTINALSFTTDLEMVDSSDVVKTDNTAAKIRVAANLIGGKVSVTADELDEILIKDATDGALKRATVKTAVQSQVATTVATGVCELATAAKLIDPSGAAANDVISAATGSPMLTKAWVEFASSGSDIAQTITNSFNITSLTRNGEGIYDILFATVLPSDKYVVVATGYNTGSKDLMFGRITSRTATGVGCTVTFGEFENVLTVKDPTGVATLVFYGLTS